MPPEPVDYQYLVVSEKMEDVQHADLVTVRNFDRSKERLKKKIHVGAGLEVQIAHVRAMDAKGVARWFVQVQDLYRFCKFARCQLVVSSGATSPQSMVSGRSLDALLQECGMEPAKYWAELEKWLEMRLARRVTA